MSLMRQVALLLISVLLLALAGAVGINLSSTRDALQTQLRVKNADNAQNIALALSQQRGDRQLMGLLLATQADTGFYRRVRFVGSDGAALFEREAIAQPSAAPAWFARWWPIESAPGVAQVSDGWRALGRVEVVSHVAYAHDELWRGGAQALLLLGALGVAAMALAAAGVRRIRRPLDATVSQANALVEGRYLLVDEPAVPELRRVAQAMNGMVERVRRLFESQAAQVEQLRREAHEDRLTALPHRAHFMQRLAALLGDDASAEAGWLLLVRVADLADVNRELGRDATDRALRSVAETLRSWPHDGTQGALAGRLNGADFALVLPGASALGRDAPGLLAAALRSALSWHGERVMVHLGAVRWAGPAAAGALLARADLALARAEGLGPFAAEIAADLDADNAASRAASGGEQVWHRHLQDALHAGRARLAEFVVVDRGGALSHLECPLRLQLVADGAFESAARWLPLASRSKMLPAIDLLAVRLALTTIGTDGRPRAVNLALASLADGAFTTQLRQLLIEAPRGARGLWLEVAEGAALGHFELLRAFAALVRPLGVRFGLEHAGHQLYRTPRLYETGLDYVKLDVALVRGAAHDEAVRRFVAGSVALLRALPLTVCAEGVDDAADAAALWECGVEAITGPWASARPTRSTLA
jgi:EAL domain-containing protein (putative c-di-GMP-specific phosphodiesterase class I)/GGDEF domain-containing protein